MIFFAELLPLLAFLHAAALLTLPGAGRWAATAPRLLLALAVISTYTTVASTLQWNLVFNGDAPNEWKQTLGRLLSPAVATPGPEGDRVDLSTLKPLSEKADLVPLRLDTTIDGNPLQFRGRPYPRGIGMHAQASATWRVPAGATYFEAIAGLPDEVNQCIVASVVFEVLGDGGRSLFRSRVVRSTEAPVPVLVDVRGMETLTLVVSDAGDGRDCDHGSWADAAFIVPNAPR